jgi:hypothetical protein
MAETHPPDARGQGNLITGGVLTAFAALMLLAVVCWVTPKGFVDFPCFDVQEGECLATHTGPWGEIADVSDVRMFLCISRYPRSFQGGGTIAQGPESSNTWSRGDIELTRQGETLIVNGQSLVVGESFNHLRVFPTLNPWLLTSTRTKITNRGVFDCLLDEEGNEQTLDALYVYGSVSEGWFPNPLGLIILGVGIWLLVRGVRERKSELQP